MRMNRLKKIGALFISFMMLYMVANANASSVSGGDISREVDADVVVDIVFAIDTSSSMNGEARNISDAIQSALTNMECVDIDVWVNARLVGIRGGWGGTLFDERAESVLASVGASITINSSEDNGPVVFDFATANSAYYIDTTEPNQGYAKAIVTIGDEGLQNGSPVNQLDYDIGKMANAIAIENNIRVFSLLGDRPRINAPALFKVLAEGGDTLGGHTFSDTGGTFTTTTATTPFEEVLEDVFCQSAQTVLKNVKVVSVLSTNDVVLDSSSFSQLPHSIETIGNETFIEWRFPSISIGQIENLDYEVILQNPIPGEKRLVTHQLDVYYTDINGNEVYSGLDNQTIDVLPSVFKITVDTDKPTYTSNENVQIATQVSNLSQYDQIVDVKVSVQDSAGTVVEDFSIIQNIAIHAGETWQYTALNFATATTIEGLYQVRAQLLDQNSNEIALAIAPLVFVTPAENKVEGTITTDKAVYEASDTVNLQSRIQNITPNALLDGYTATTTIYAPNNEIVWSTKTKLPQLLPNSIKDVNAVVALQSALSGNYRAVLIVSNENGIKRALSETGFIVQSTAITGSGLLGSISVAPNPVLKTEYLTLNATVTNAGNSDLNNLPITISIIDPENEAVVVEWTQSLSNLTVQQENAIQHTWQTFGLVGATYIAALTVRVSGNTKYLAQTPFVMAEKIVTHQMIGESGRVLILLDSLHEDDAGTEDDDDGSDDDDDDDESDRDLNDDEDDDSHIIFHEPALTEQQAYLEKLLTEYQWFYTIVTEKEAFTREFRTGSYTVYALFSEQEKLSKQVQQELREAVFRGDGLLVAGNYDHRHNKLDSAVGLEFEGKLGDVEGIELFSTTFPVSGIGHWVVTEKPVKVTNQGAEVIAYYLGASQKIAATRHSYGEGRSLFAGFDLLAQASQIDADPLFGGLILEGLMDIVPDTAKTQSGAPASVRLQLTNKGIAALGQAMITIPENTTIIDSGTAQPQTNNRLLWPFDLVEEATETLKFWLQLPQQQDNIDITSFIQLGTAPELTDYATVSLSLPIDSAPTLQDVLALPGIQKKPYKKIRKDIEKAQHALEKGDYAKALKYAIKATNRFDKISDSNARTIRLNLDNAIRVIARQF